MSSVDWKALAETLGTITYVSGGHQEQGGSKIAADALIKIIGDAVLRDAVDHYVAGRPGAELARSVLCALRPPSGMDRCHKIFLTSGNEQDASLAINLLQGIADKRVLPWIRDYLASDNIGVRLWAVGIVDQLLIMHEDIEPAEAMPLIEMALRDADERVRDRAQQLLNMIDREE